MSNAGHAGVAPLRRYAVKPGGNSLSGLSSGGAMTVQMHLAHSSCFVGAGVIAAGPYRAAESFRKAAVLAEDAYVLGADYICMSPLTDSTGPDPERSVRLAQQTAQAGRIDPVAHLDGQRVYIFTGKEDRYVHSSVVRATSRFYEGLRAKVCLVDTEPAGHAILTDDPEDQAISENQPPYINFSGYEGRAPYMQSHVMLDHIYGRQAVKPAASTLAGEIVSFDQTQFFASDDDKACASLGEVGFLYVPGSVKAGGKARGVHICLHGCKQGYSFVDYVNGRADRANRAPYGRRYVISTGYNHWAEANDLIVLYPQVEARDDNIVQNPDGCWDWWGYSSLDRDAPDYYSQGAVQIRILHAMLERICGPAALRT